MFDDENEVERWDNTNLNTDNEDDDGAISWDDLLSEDGDKVIEEKVNANNIDLSDVSDEDDIVIDLNDESALDNIPNWNSPESNDTENEVPVMEETKSNASFESVSDMYSDNEYDSDENNDSELQDITELELNDDEQPVLIDENGDEVPNLEESLISQDDKEKSKIKQFAALQNKKAFIPQIAGIGLAILVVVVALFIYAKVSQGPDLKVDNSLQNEEVQSQSSENMEGLSPEGPVSMQEYNSEEMNQKIKQQQEENKKVIVSVVNTGRSNPFTPAGNFSIAGFTIPSAVDVMGPPTGLNDNPDLAALVDIQVSGIMYDAVKPSAIITISGVDHFVQRGDLIDNFVVTQITPTSVLIKNGKNFFRAQIGQSFNIKNGIVDGQTKYVRNKNSYTRQYFTPQEEDETSILTSSGSSNNDSDNQ